MPLNETFTALLNEAQFTKEILGAGATQIRQANYARKGVYFQSFTSLSTGLERIGKLCLILDYYIDNQSTFPDFNYLKNKIGHKLDALYRKSQEIVEKRKIDFRFLPTLDDPIHSNILTVLTAFATGDRYSNINLLVGGNNQTDPIALWFSSIDTPIFESKVSKAKKEKILANAKMANQLAGHMSLVLHVSETNTEISDFEEASFRTGMQEAVSPFRQLYVVQIIRYWSELLIELQYHAMSQNHEDIPYFSEIVGGFCNEDSYIKRLKRWDNI